MKYTYLLAITFALLLTACEDKGPAEKAGEKVDEVVENTKDKTKEIVEGAKDKTEEIVDGAKDKAEEVGNKIEDACEEAKEAADAKDTDC